MNDFRILFYMVLGTAVIVFLLCCLIGICRFIGIKKREIKRSPEPFLTFSYHVPVLSLWEYRQLQISDGYGLFSVFRCFFMQSCYLS